MSGRTTDPVFKERITDWPAGDWQFDRQVANVGRRAPFCSGDRLFLAEAAATVPEETRIGGLVDLHDLLLKVAHPNADCTIVWQDRRLGHIGPSGRKT